MLVSVPDDMVMSVLSQRLCRLDTASRGWVVHGYPLTRDQAELLNNSGHAPNRVFFLNIPEESVRERLTLRRLDPVTGERCECVCVCELCVCVKCDGVGITLCVSCVCV